MAEKSPTENPTPSPEVENEWKRIWAKIGNVHQSKTKEVSMDSKWISLEVTHGFEDGSFSSAAWRCTSRLLSCAKS